MRRHFRFEAKWSETEAKFLSLRCEKKCFFRLFCIDAKRRNLTRNEHGTKRKKTKEKRKIAIIFASKRNKAKRKWKNAIIFASKRNGSKIFFASMRIKCFFAYFRIWNETKMKLSKNKAKKHLFRFALKRNERLEAKRSETKNFWKWNKVKIRSINFALVGSKKFEAKWSEKKRKTKCFFPRESAKRVRNGSRFVSFRFEAKKFFLRNWRTLDSAYRRVDIPYIVYEKSLFSVSLIAASRVDKWSRFQFFIKPQ